MDSAKSATSKDELAGMLPITQWYSKLPTKVVEGFLNTIEYVQGHLAHMEHDQIRNVLSEQEFSEFLFIVGTNQEKFKKYNSKFCAGNMQYRYCADGSGYCDPSWCHAN